MKKIKLATISLACMLAASSVGLVACGGSEDNVVKDFYEIKIACQSEDSEKKVLVALRDAYQAIHPDTKIEITTFTGKDFEAYMNQIALDKKGSPQIIWTSDSYHGRWHKHFIDLRPFYEETAETDYSLYYASMLDTAALNGKFKPTKNYKGSFRADDLDNSDGKEHYRKHSEYGLYYAPRDYNKPAILCNTYLFEKLDVQYAAYYLKKEGVEFNGATTMDRLNAIVAGENWDEITDMFDFAKMIAERLTYVINYATSLKSEGVEVKGYWMERMVLDMKLEWEPVYTTILTALGVDTIIKEDGTLKLTENSEALETLHSYLYPENIKNLCFSEQDDTVFAQGKNFMKIVSRPIVLGYSDTFQDLYGDTYLQSIQIPTEKIAAGNSGYAISNYYQGKSITLKKTGEKKYYEDICWDFIKFIITHDGQEVAGATGNNIPVLKSLYDAESNGGVEPAWRTVTDLQGMNHDAWVAGEELAQEWYNVYDASKRYGFRLAIQAFFKKFVTQNYTDGSLSELIKLTNAAYNNYKPKDALRK